MIFNKIILKFYYLYNSKLYEKGIRTLHNLQKRANIAEIFVKEIHKVTQHLI